MEQVLLLELELRPEQEPGLALPTPQEPLVTLAPLLAPQLQLAPAEQLALHNRFLKTKGALNLPPSSSGNVQVFKLRIRCHLFVEFFIGFFNFNRSQFKTFFFLTENDLESDVTDNETQSNGRADGGGLDTFKLIHSAPKIPTHETGEGHDGGRCLNEVLELVE